MGNKDSFDSLKQLAVSIRIYLVKRLCLSGLLTYLLILTQPIYAQESPLAEKIRDVSPDKKFAMRISYDANMNQELIKGQNANAEKIFPQAIKAIGLVSLPQKVVVADLPWDRSAVDVSLTWSSDSKWCAFYANMSRTSETTVYHLRGDKFVEMGGEEELEVDVKGDVRLVWVTPIRWIKPGVLLLEQHVTNGKDATYRFTARFEEKTGKFRIISKKKVPSKE